MFAAITSTVLSALKDSSRYTVSRMDNNQETISKLKFIGKLKKGDKINTRHMYIQPDSLGTSLSRTFFYQDNRENAVSFCQDTVRNSFDLVELYERSAETGDQLLVQNLISDLQQSKTGLINLKYTYASDTMVCCKIDALLENVGVKLARFQDSLGEGSTTTSTRTPTNSPSLMPSIPTVDLPPQRVLA